jgi:hypothetical protein
MSSPAAPSAPTLQSRVQVKDDVLFQELQGESVLLNLDSGIYFGLDAVGTRMWQLIVEQEQLAEVAQAITAEYDVSEEQCAADLLALVARLEGQGLVTVTA